MSQAERKKKISSAQPLPVVKQCQLLSIPRSSAYYQPRQVSEEDLELMRILDELSGSVVSYCPTDLSSFNSKVSWR